MSPLNTSKDNYTSIYTDGSCHPQLSFGAWVAIIIIGDRKIILKGEALLTTHHRMELLAVIKAILYLRQSYPERKVIHLITDSQYVSGLIERETRLKARSFKTRKGLAIRNSDLVEDFYRLKADITLNVTKVKAHSPNNTIPENKEADILCRSLVRKMVDSNKEKMQIKG